MSRKHFSWLLLATFLAGAVVLMLPQQTAKEGTAQAGLFLPDLEDQVNDIGWLQLTAAGGSTVATLERKDGRWSVKEASGYPADWNAVRELLSSLAQSRVVESKTDNPEYYQRLGVEDVSSQSAGGIMVSFAPDTGLSPVIVGNSARSRTGQYVRMADAASSALIDTALNVPAERAAWLETSIVDISDAEVVEVKITHPGGESVKIFKASAEDENFQLENVPEGREAKSDWSVNALGNVLASLELNEVAAQEELNWEGSSQLYLLTADGLVIEASMLEREGPEDGSNNEYWIKLEAQVFTTGVGGVSDGESTGEDTLDRAEMINQRVRGWAYRIPQYKYNAMNRRMQDLLQAEDESSSL